MKKILALAVAIIIALSILLFLQMKKNGATVSPAPPETATNADSQAKSDTNGEAGLKVDAATQKLMGLQTQALIATELAPQLKGFGRVIDPVAISTTVSDYLTARATAEVSQKELARLKILAAQNNASARTVEAAEGASQRDDALAAAARAKIVAAVGVTVADNPNLAALVKSLVSGEQAVVEIDLPVGETLDPVPATAQLVPAGDVSSPLEGRFIGSPLAVDLQTLTRGILFLIETNQSRLAAGAPITALLKTSGAAQNGVTVPRDAIIRYNGATWLYLQQSDESFQRSLVELKYPLVDGWFALALKPGDKVVTTGAQQLLSEELKSKTGGD